MPVKYQNIEDYMKSIPIERKNVFEKLRKLIHNNIPKGFEQGILYNMVGFYVPHSIYPKGYHVNPKDPLPFVNIANQKNFIALYHSGIYANEELKEWFVSEYVKQCKYKIDMGKSCIRFKKMEDIPFDLIKELIQKMSVEVWIQTYEKIVSKK